MPALDGVSPPRTISLRHGTVALYKDWVGRRVGGMRTTPRRETARDGVHGISLIWVWVIRMGAWQGMIEVYLGAWVGLWVGGGAQTRWGRRR
jgi:hypothetical protein